MDRRREAVLDPHVGLAGAADRQPAEEVVALARRQTAAPDGDRKPVAAARPPGPTGRKPVASGAGAVVRRSSRRALRETRTKQVENGEEAELEGDRDRFGIQDALMLDVEDELDRPERDAVSGRQPGGVDDGRSPYPVRRLKSTICQSPVEPAQLGVASRDVGVVEHAVSRERPSTAIGPSST